MVIGYGYNIEAARRVKEEIANAGVPLQDDQAPPKQSNNQHHKIVNSTKLHPTTSSLTINQPNY